MPDIEDTFREQAAENMMRSMSFGEARTRVGERLRVAALGAVPQGSEHRIIHDGTHFVCVNPGIRVRDQEAAPTHADLTAVLNHEASRGSSAMFGLVFDVSKAHRRIGVIERDWGLQACATLARGCEPSESDEVWVNTVGTYGIGSA
ncbi:MAG: hypothetical protein GY704_15280, partial [Phycisphaeraceae bacterium]|nr:hypothetical protein [Phycisphaeraceae bacterium]